MSLYRVLGIAQVATKEEIKTAYKRRALTAHPDKGGTKEGFHAVTHAFETLFDDLARSRYGARLARSARSRPAASAQCRDHDVGTEFRAKTIAGARAGLRKP